MYVSTYSTNSKAVSKTFEERNFESRTNIPIFVRLCSYEYESREFRYY